MAKRRQKHGLEGRSAAWWEKHFVNAGEAFKKWKKDFPRVMRGIDREQFVKGVVHEMEHTSSPEVAARIALDHLAEHRYYYDALEKMEHILNLAKKHNVRANPIYDVICAWCGRKLGSKDTSGPSHGICEVCMKKLLLDIEKKKSKRR